MKGCNSFLNYILLAIFNYSTGQGVGMNYKLVCKMAGVQLSLDCTFVEYPQG